MSESQTSKQRDYLAELEEANKPARALLLDAGRYINYLRTVVRDMLPHFPKDDPRHVGFSEAAEGIEPAPDTTPQAPIAHVTVIEDYGGYRYRWSMYAPGLPPGTHDLYCEPPAPGGRKVPHPCFAPEAEALCVVCQTELPPLNQWSMPACPSCTEKAERASAETTNEAHGPPFTVDRFGSLGECVIAERNWLRKRLAAHETSAERCPETFQPFGGTVVPCVLPAGHQGKHQSPDPLPANTSGNVRALFNKGIGVLKDNRFSFSFNTDEEAERAFHYIADLGTLETGSAGDVSAPRSYRPCGCEGEACKGHPEP